MPLNKNALIRIKTIDKCLQNHYRKWTIEDLIEACSQALYEYEGSNKDVSLRTIRADLALMRSDKLGYNAPIIITSKKYYTYEDPAYTITNIPLSTQDLHTISEAVDVLKQFKGFNHFQGLNGVVSKLEDKIYTEKSNQHAIIDFEKNENLKGLEYLDTLYKAIQAKQTLQILYQSYKSRSGNWVVFHPWLLKEFRNRWFVIGVKGKKSPIVNFALDRIQEIKFEKSITYYRNPDFNAATYYKDVVGVTVNEGTPPHYIRLFVNRDNAPYIISKPIHHSQRVEEQRPDGVVLSLFVIPNFELEKEILGFGEAVRVVWPRNIRKRITRRLKQAVENYDSDTKPL
ncbi:MAG TPA: WYL domain-containing protein [Chitinophagales bacterium]|nr:WYL domain-containing protein [Chitinophagales bacterium]